MIQAFPEEKLKNTSKNHRTFLPFVKVRLKIPLFFAIIPRNFVS